MLTTHPQVPFTETPPQGWSRERELLLQQHISDMGLRIEGTYLVKVIAPVHRARRSRHQATAEGVSEQRVVVPRFHCTPGLRADDPQNWKFYIIEVNPNPYLDENAEVAMAARESGLSYAALLEKILESTERRAMRS